MPPMLPSLKAKMTAAVSLLVAAILILSAWATFSYFRKEFTRTILREQETLVGDIAEHLDDTLSTNRQILVTIARLLGPDASKSSSIARPLLEREEHARLLFDGLILFSPGGRIMAAVPPAPPGTVEDTEKLRCLKEVIESQKPVTCGPELLPDGRPGVALAVPVFDGEGRVSAVLAGTYNLTERNFLGKLALVRIGKSGRLTLSGSDGTVIMSTDRSLLLKKLPASSDTLTSSRKLASADWTVTASYPLADAYAPISRARWYFSVVLVLMTAAAVFFVQLVMGRLTAPLVKFTRHVEEMPEREGARKLITIPSGDEIESLSESFNVMVRELERQRDDIQKSGALYRTVVLFTAQFAFLRGASGEVDFISPNCDRITGYEDTEFYAYPDLLERLVYPDDREKWSRCRESLRAGRTSCSFDLRIVTKEGKTRWMSAACESVTDGGAVTGIRGNFSDITERKLAEEALRQSNMTMEAVMTAAPFAVVALDRDLTVTLWNAAAERIFGWRRDEILGRRYPLMPTASEESIIRERVQGGHSVAGMAVRRRTRAGVLVDLMMYTSPLGPDGSSGSLAVFVATGAKEKGEAP
jgi:two-component system, NtrC family, sensor kinase